MKTYGFKTRYLNFINMYQGALCPVASHHVHGGRVSTESFISMFLMFCYPLLFLKLHHSFCRWLRN